MFLKNVIISCTVGENNIGVAKLSLVYSKCKIILVSWSCAFFPYYDRNIAYLTITLSRKVFICFRIFPVRMSNIKEILEYNYNNEGIRISQLA